MLCTFEALVRDSEMAQTGYTSRGKQDYNRREHIVETNVHMESVLLTTYVLNPLHNSKGRVSRTFCSFCSLTSRDHSQ